jgi:hypothetical protein
MTPLLLIAALALTPVELTVCERCCVVERNHVFMPDDGRPAFTQNIFLSHDGERLQVIAWRISRDLSTRPTAHGRGYVTRFRDGDVWRAVYSDSFRESWTTWDRELHERSILSTSKRRGLAWVKPPGVGR